MFIVHPRALITPLARVAGSLLAAALICACAHPHQASHPREHRNLKLVQILHPVGRPASYIYVPEDAPAPGGGQVIAHVRR